LYPATVLKPFKRYRRKVALEKTQLLVENCARHIPKSDHRFSVCGSALVFDLSIAVLYHMVAEQLLNEMQGLTSLKFLPLAVNDVPALM
jgi:hypothetical protein